MSGALPPASSEPPGADRAAHRDIADVVAFWREAREDWFSKNPDFDRRFRARFLPLHEEVVAGRHDDWLATPDGALALLILTDQFPRNAFRGTPRMYASDPLARRYARAARDAGYMERVAQDLRPFLALPFAHSECLADQEISVALNMALGQPWLGHAEGHRDIIRRFGRFPHRNAILGRQTSEAEAAFLGAGGFQG